jgi:hypothetical protein
MNNFFEGIAVGLGWILFEKFGQILTVFGILEIVIIGYCWSSTEKVEISLGVVNGFWFKG